MSKAILCYLQILIQNHPYYIAIISGLVSGIVYAPYFIILLWFALPILLFALRSAKNYRAAFSLGYLFGFGHFLTSLYWIANALLVFKTKFLWFVPFAIAGLPLILGCFIGLTCLVTYFFRESRFFVLIFSTLWIIFEYIRSFIFTGFPWNLAGYSLFFSDILIQPIFLISIYGLSFIVIYLFSGFVYIILNDFSTFRLNFAMSSFLIILCLIYGKYRLDANPTQFLDTKIRVIQTSIQQSTKWDQDQFWKNLDRHIVLSNYDNGFKPDIILWSESAIAAPINYKEIRDYIAGQIIFPNTDILTGAIYQAEECKEKDIHCPLFVSFSAIDPKGDIVLLYHKIHLVPFGEYVPFKNILPIKKVTAGFTDFTAGNTNKILKLNNLNVRPLICYEAIFPDEIDANARNTDLLINITNDAWYGNSMGPYQHFQIARGRSVEAGLPMIRAASNGISAIIDPMGRIIKYAGINDVKILDSYIPDKYTNTSIPNIYKYLLLVLVISVNYLIQMLIRQKYWDYR